MPLTTLVQIHREAIKAIVTANNGENPRELPLFESNRLRLLGEVNILIDPLETAEWGDLVDMENELSELLGKTVCVFATSIAIPTTALSETQQL